MLIPRGESFHHPMGGFLELPTQDRTPGSFSFSSPRRAWRRNVGIHAWGLWQGSRLWAPNTVYPHPLTTWVRAPPPSSDRFAQFLKTLCPWPGWNRAPSVTVFSPGLPLPFFLTRPGRQGIPHSGGFSSLPSCSNSLPSSSWSHRSGFRSQPHCWPPA